MTRTDFVNEYARKSNLSDRWAILGLVVVGDQKLIALPCGCHEPECQGWAMVSAEGVLSHLENYTPEPLRTAYIETLLKGNRA